MSRTWEELAVEPGGGMHETHVLEVTPPGSTAKACLVRVFMGKVFIARQSGAIGQAEPIGVSGSSSLAYLEGPAAEAMLSMPRKHAPLAAVN